MAMILAMVLAATGCQASGLSKTVSTLELGYGQSYGTIDSRREEPLGFEDEGWAWWLTIHPLAALEPPQPVYEVDRPEAEYLSFQSPFSYEPDPVVAEAHVPWWYRLDEVRGLLLWIGAGLLAGITALAAKLGFDKRAEEKRNAPS